MKETRMKMRLGSRAAVIAATGSVIALALSGCSGSAEPASNAKSVGFSTITPGSITIGSCLDEPPYGLRNSAGDPDGFDVDLAKEIAKYVKLKLVTVDVTANDRIPAMQTGKVDLMSCSFTMNAERAQQIDFTNPTIASGMSLLVLKGSPIKTVAQLTGKVVGVNKGGTAGPVTTAVNPKAKQQAYDSSSASLLALKSGQVDAVVDSADEVSLDAASDPKLKIAIDGSVGPTAYMGLGVPKGKTALLKRLNAFVQQWHTDGDDAKLFEKWFKVTPTSQFKNLPVTKY